MLLIVFLLVFGFILARTVYGEAIYAIGGNYEASRLSGIRVRMVITSTYVLLGGCVGLAGSIAASGTVSESSGKWAYAPSHLSDGTYTAEASQKDEAGHTGESTAVTFTVDTVPPALTLLTPGNETLPARRAARR